MTFYIFFCIQLYIYYDTKYVDNLPQINFIRFRTFTTRFLKNNL